MANAHISRVQKMRQNPSTGEQAREQSPCASNASALSAMWRASSSLHRQCERGDSGRWLPVVGRLFVGVGVLNDLCLIPGSREYLQTSGQTLDVTIRYGERRPLQHAADKGETAAQMCGAGMGSRFGVIGNLGVAVAVDGWELRPRWEHQCIDASSVHGLHKSHAETCLIATAFDGRRIVLGRQRGYRFVEALLV